MLRAKPQAILSCRSLFFGLECVSQYHRERVADWLRRLTRKPKVRMAVGSNPALDSLVAVHNSIPGRPEPCEGNLLAAAFHFLHFKLFKHKIPSAIQNNTTKKNLITIIHYNIYIITVYLFKTYLDAAALPGSRVFVFFQLLK